MSTEITKRASLQVAFADAYGIQPDKVFALLRDTALKSKDPVTDAEVAAFMIVCNEYKLNPFIKEIYGFISKGKMQYVVSVDGWITFINRHPQLNGIEFIENFSVENGKKTIESVTCTIHRKDRALPTVITEYYLECRRDTDNWKQQPIRMTRHKSLIQTARVAFGFAGVIDEDEASSMEGFTGPIIEGNTPDVDREAEELFNKLKYNTSQRKSCQRNFSTHDAMMDYLRGEVAKMGSKQKEPTVIRGETKPNPEVSKEEDTTASEIGTMEEVSTSQESKPAQKKPVPDDNW
jgi:phage recombination protein Bet